MASIHRLLDQGRRSELKMKEICCLRQAQTLGLEVERDILAERVKLTYSLTLLTPAGNVEIKPIPTIS